MCLLCYVLCKTYRLVFLLYILFRRATFCRRSEASLRSLIRGWPARSFSSNHLLYYFTFKCVCCLVRLIYLFETCCINLFSLFDFCVFVILWLVMYCSFPRDAVYAAGPPRSFSSNHSSSWCISLYVNAYVSLFASFILCSIYIYIYTYIYIYR